MRGIFQIGRVRSPTTQLHEGAGRGSLNVLTTQKRFDFVHAFRVSCSPNSISRPMYPGSKFTMLRHQPWLIAATKPTAKKRNAPGISG